MAKKTKFQIGDEVRLKRNTEYGNVQVRKTTKGKVKAVEGGGFMAKTWYTVEWFVTGRPVINHIESDLDFSRVM